MKNTDQLKETYDIRAWQAIHVSQLSYVRNLFIILSTAIIGFITSLLLGDDAENLNCFTIILMKFSCIIFLISTALGIILSINESKNYRLKYTASRILKKDVIDEDGFKKNEDKCSRLEKTNNCLFHTQLYFFLGAFVILVIGLLIN
jgi:hypothetical protein